MTPRRRLKGRMRSRETTAAIGAAVAARLTEEQDACIRQRAGRSAWAQAGLEDQMKGWAGDETF